MHFFSGSGSGRASRGVVAYFFKSAAGSSAESDSRGKQRGVWRGGEPAGDSADNIFGLP